MKKILVITLCLFFLLSGCAKNTTSSVRAELPQGTSAEDPVQYCLSLAYSGPETSINGHLASSFKSFVEDLSGGTVRIELFSDGILGSDSEVADNCRYGSVDIQIAGVSNLSELVPEMALFDYPFVFDDLKSARAALADEEILSFVSNAFFDQDLILLSLQDQGFEHLGFSKKISSADDFDSIVIGCEPDECRTAMWKALGFKVINMDSIDIYLALQKGTIQSQSCSYEQVYSRNIYEVQKYVTDSRHLLSISTISVGKSCWNRLPEKIQSVLRNAALLSSKSLPSYVDEENEILLEQMMRNGIRVISFDSIPRMRDLCREKAQSALRDRIESVTGSIILNRWCSFGS